VDWTLEVVVIPVSDIDRSVAFYRDQAVTNGPTGRPVSDGGGTARRR
jgi:catechol 2,3-dioxygenase-like lactoylglutathione lyase family enzyme